MLANSIPETLSCLQRAFASGTEIASYVFRGGTLKDGEGRRKRAWVSFAICGMRSVDAKSTTQHPMNLKYSHRYIDKRFKLILNPVSDVYAIHALLDAAQENPDWARELFRSHDRAERVLNILTASGCEDALYEAHSWGVGEYDSEDGCNGLREGV